MPPFFTVNVFIKRNNISKDCDFVFTFTYKKNLGTGRGVKAYFFNCDTGFVQVYNAFSHTIDIDYQLKFSYISELSETHFYEINKEYEYLANAKFKIYINKHRN